MVKAVGSKPVTSSARARSVGGIVMPSILAVCALTTNSSFVALGYAQLYVGYRNFSGVIGGLTLDAAAHRIQFAIRERTVIFERDGERSVHGRVHDFLHQSFV